MEACKEFATVAETVADCAVVVGTTAIRHRQLQQPVKLLAQGARTIRARLLRSPVAILFGSEKWGLSNDSLSHCHWVLHIPTREEHQSMNLGQAVAVCLYELVRAEGRRATAAMPESLRLEKPASLGVVERITATLLAALRSSEYINPKTGQLAEEKLRRMIRRMTFHESDAEVFLGMLHKIVWKLQQEKEKR